MVDYELPTLRNDSDTLEEQLTDTAYHQILPPRYLKKDEDGKVVEEQEELFERVAKNIAVAEAAHHEHPIDLKREELRDEIVERHDGEIPDTVSDKGEFVRLTERSAKFVSYDVLEDRDGPASAKTKYFKEKFQEQMESLKFIPNTPTLANAGDRLQMLSACFVDSPEDDIDNIHETAKEAAKVFQAGGGMGYAFQHLRPYGDPVGSTGGIASGPITFMRTFDQMCETIAQGGMRRGAQMAIMKVSHPDVIQFIHAKDKDVSLAETLRLNDPDDFTHNSFSEALEEARELIRDGKVPKHLRNASEGHLSNFNISVGITEQFMEAVSEDREFTFHNPHTDEAHVATEGTKELYDIYGLGEYVEVGEVLSVPARELWEKIAEGAHENGEPGVVFLDRINEKHSFDVEKHPKYKVHATNPCGEQPLMEYEACNLGHINLSTIVSEDAPNWEEWADGQSMDALLDEVVESFLDAAINWHDLDERITLGTRFLDNVVTMSDFPVPEIEETVRRNRKIGLGVMGLAQLYVQLGVVYGSREANEIGRQLMSYINKQSKLASNSLAEEKGTFVNWGDSKWSDPDTYQSFWESHMGTTTYDDNGFPIRNHNTTTIAPTGTTSMVGNTTGGCEPIYNVANFKNVTDDVQGDEMLVQFDSLFLETLRVNDIPVEDIKQQAKRQMENNEFEGIESLDVPYSLKELFVTTDELSAEEHASVQCALQESVDSAISKTVNAPFEHTVEDSMETFEYVYENGGKGVTYYRDGTRNKQVLTTRQDNSLEDVGEDEVVEFIESHKDDGDFIKRIIESADLEELTSQADMHLSPRERPDRLSGETIKVETGYGNMYVTVNTDESGAPFEVMATVGKSGATMEADTEAIARLISLNLRSGVSVTEVIDQLKGIEADRIAWQDGEAIRSVAEGIAYGLREATDPREPSGNSEGYDGDLFASPDTSPTKSDGGVAGCPSCGSETILREGCEECESCGWSKC